MAASESTETRAVIKFCVNLGMTPTQTMDSIRQANMKDNVSQSLIFKWHKRFQDGRETVQGDKGRGRKPKIGATLLASVEERVTQDKRVTIRELVRDTGVSYGTVWTILKDKLNMSRVCARWVPRLLTSVERERRVEDSRKFLRRYNREGEDFLNRIITTDETWSRGYKTFFMLNSAEHEIYPAHKC